MARYLWGKVVKDQASQRDIDGMKKANGDGCGRLKVKMISDNQYRLSVLVLLGLVVLVLVCLVVVEQWRYDVAIRSHNLQVMAELVRCSNHESANAADCEQMMDTFMVPETGLFAR